MRHVLVAELMGTTVVMLALTAAPAGAQTLGEVSAATGIHGTLSRQSVGSARGTLDTVNRSLAKSTKPKDLGFGVSSGAKPGARSKPTVARSGGSSGGGRTGTGSWATGASTSRGSTSSAWLQGGSGWATGGGGARTPGNRRPRS